jgi:tRNA U34 2-thiouridine synthase MnmA/TrmU
MMKLKTVKKNGCNGTHSIQTAFTAVLHQHENGMYIVFEELQSAITEGQFAAWYSEMN